MALDQVVGMARGHRRALAVAAVLGAWGLVMAAGGCGAASTDRDSRGEDVAIHLDEVVGTPQPVTDAGTVADAGTVPWGGPCTSNADCNPAAASLCGDNTEVYCKFPVKKDGGAGPPGTCACRDRQQQPRDAGAPVTAN